MILRPIIIYRRDIITLYNQTTCEKHLFRKTPTRGKKKKEKKKKNVILPIVHNSGMVRLKDLKRQETRTRNGGVEKIASNSINRLVLCVRTHKTTGNSGRRRRWRRRMPSNIPSRALRVRLSFPPPLAREDPK